MVFDSRSPRQFLHAAALASLAVSLASPSYAAVVPVLINEYEVRGVTLVRSDEIEDAVYPYLGPDRDPEEVEHARQAVEELYHSRGYKTVLVTIPKQDVVDGVVVLQVQETPIARTRVKGARYTSPERIIEQAPSMAEGRVLNFDNLPTDLAALNRNPDVQVTPSLLPGDTPGSVEVNLEVKDRPPVHANVELNNRAGPDTRPLRLNAGVRLTNLWQRAHVFGFNTQVAPQDMSQVKVFSGFYSVPFKGERNPTLTFQASVQRSDISTLGAANVVGRNEVAGVRWTTELPSPTDTLQTLSFGIDAKRAHQKLKLTPTDAPVETPATYFPLVASYSATAVGKTGKTEFNADLNFHLRGLGSTELEWDNNRYKADGSYVFLRADLARTQDLFAGFQAFGKVQGQIASLPLLSLEQFSAGGLGTVRGYLESAAVGDNGATASFEFRSPNLAFWDAAAKRSEIRLYGFVDGAYLTLNSPAPGVKDYERLASYGGGLRCRIVDTFSGSVDAGVPLFDEGQTRAHTVRVTFRAGLEY